MRQLAAGESLFNQGDRAVAIYQVDSGRLRLVRRTSDDHLVILHTARRGEFFAEASLLPKPTTAMPWPPPRRGCAGLSKG